MSDFASSLHAVDEEFEAVATQVLKRTQTMVNKYRRLLLVEAEVRPQPARGQMCKHTHAGIHVHVQLVPPPFTPLLSFNHSVSARRQKWS